MMVRWDKMAVLVGLIVFAFACGAFATSWVLIDDFSSDLSAWTDESIAPGSASIGSGSGPDGSSALELDMTTAQTGKLARIALNNTPQLGTYDSLKIAFDMWIDPSTTKNFTNGLMFIGSPNTIYAGQYGKSSWDSSVCGQFYLNSSWQGKDPDGSDRREQVGNWYHYEVEMSSTGSSLKVYQWISSNPADYASATPIWTTSISEGIGDSDYVLKFQNDSKGNPDSYAQNRGLAKIDNVYYQQVPEPTTIGLLGLGLLGLCRKK